MVPFPTYRASHGLSVLQLAPSQPGVRAHPGYPSALTNVILQPTITYAGDCSPAEALSGVAVGQPHVLPRRRAPARSEGIPLSRIRGGSATLNEERDKVTCEVTRCVNLVTSHHRGNFKSGSLSARGILAWPGHRFNTASLSIGPPRFIVLSPKIATDSVCRSASEARSSTGHGLLRGKAKNQLERSRRQLPSPLARRVTSWPAGHRERRFELGWWHCLCRILMLFP